MIPRRGLCLGIVLLTSLFVVALVVAQATRVQAGIIFTSEDHFVDWLRSAPDRRATAIIPEWVDAWPNVTRADLAAAVSVIGAWGYGDNFARCSVDETITVQPNDTRAWHWREQGNPANIVPGQLQDVFAPGVVLHVFKYGENAFVAKACGNFSAPPPPIPGTLRVVKYHDSNMNAQQDPGEGEIPGWPVSYSGPQSGAGTTPLEVQVPPGTYTVSEDVDFVPPCGIAVVNGCEWRATTPVSVSATVEACETSTVTFGNVALGGVLKTVLDYWWRTPIADACITLSETDVPGDVLENCPPLPQTKCTDESGQVTFPDLLPGQYRLCVELPWPYLAWPETWCYDLVAIGCHLTSEENYAYDNPRREPRTLGFWINWRLRYSDAEMAALIEGVVIGSEDFVGLTVGNVDAYLSPAGRKVSADRMATTQYLALWLNLASDRLGFLPEVNISSIPGWHTVVQDSYGTPGDGVLSIHYLMLELREAYNSSSLTEDQWEVLKDICDAVNNYAVFLEPPTGPID